MPTLPKSLFWSRRDTAGSEHAIFDDVRGLTARGVAQAAEPVPHTCRYELSTDEGWASLRLAVEVEGAGWSRGLKLERRDGQWRATTSEQGDLDAALVAAGHPPAGLPGIEDASRLGDALDVDLGGSPLTNTLPIRRLGLRDADDGTSHRITVAWVLVPSLVVLPAVQSYTLVGPERVRYASEGFTAELEIDPEGYVLRYPGLAERAAHRPGYL